MPSIYNKPARSELIEKQVNYILSLLDHDVSFLAFPNDVRVASSDAIERIYQDLGTPLLTLRSALPQDVPWADDYNTMIHEITADLDILFNEHERVAETLSEAFNYGQTEKTRLQHRMQNLSNWTSDLHLLKQEQTPNTVYHKDSFSDRSQIDEALMTGRGARIATQEGVAMLAPASSMNRSSGSSVRAVQGNGEAGTPHLARRTVDSNGNRTGYYMFDQIPNDTPEAVLDSQPQTMFEYQRVNIPEAAKKQARGYDVSWARGAKHGDRLRVKLVLELDEPGPINWIALDPYHPKGSTNELTLYSIRTSADGFDYDSLYDGGMVLNQAINQTPHTYRVDDVFPGSDQGTSKYAGQGVWAFPSRNARFVEIVLDQSESYEELIGHTYYERIRIIRDPDTGDTTEERVRVPSDQVPDAVRELPLGEYAEHGEDRYYKGIELFDGWRYAIGLRDINIMSYEYHEKSEMVSVPYQHDREIEGVMLYANEQVPDAFQRNESQANDWIRYYISVDDIEWHPISPMHHEPMSYDQPFPPKIVDINVPHYGDAPIGMHKTVLTTERPVHQVRLKMVLSRPSAEAVDGSQHMTPILEDYALRTVLKDQT